MIKKPDFSFFSLFIDRYAIGLKIMLFLMSAMYDTANVVYFATRLCSPCCYAEPQRRREPMSDVVEMQPIVVAQPVQPALVHEGD